MMMLEDSRLIFEVVKFAKGIAQDLDRALFWSVPPLDGAVMGTDNSTQQMFDREKVQMGISTKKDGANVLVGHKATIINPTDSRPELIADSLSGKTPKPPIGRLRHGKHSHILVKEGNLMEANNPMVFLALLIRSVSSGQICRGLIAVKAQRIRTGSVTKGLRSSGTATSLRAAMKDVLATFSMSPTLWDHCAQASW